MAKYQKGIPAANLVKADHDADVEEVVESLDKFDSFGKSGAKEEDALEIIQSIFPLGGRPFTALHPQLVPQYFEEPLELFDEFGFRLAQETENDHQQQTVDPTLEKPPLESSSHRMRWLALIESAHSQVEDELCWANVDMQRLRHTPKFMPMVNDGGIPHSLRPFLWPRLCSAAEKRKKSPCDYAKIVRKCTKDSVPACINVQIEKDLLRTLPAHFCFGRPHSVGIAPLRRVLRALAFLFPEIGYCQGMAFVVASLLLVCCEENTFWMMCSLIEDILPASFYAPSLLGVRADERVLRHLIQAILRTRTDFPGTGIKPDDFKLSECVRILIGEPCGSY